MAVEPAGKHVTTESFTNKNRCLAWFNYLTTKNGGPNRASTVKNGALTTKWDVG